MCICACVYVCRAVLSHFWLCDPMDCILPGSSVHGDFQARILEWVVMPSSRGSSQARDQTQVSCIVGGFFTIWATRETQEYWSGKPISSPGELLDPGIDLGSPALHVVSLPAELLRKSVCICICVHKLRKSVGFVPHQWSVWDFVQESFPVGLIKSLKE